VPAFVEGLVSERMTTIPNGEQNIRHKYYPILIICSLSLALQNSNPLCLQIKSLLSAHLYTWPLLPKHIHKMFFLLHQVIKRFLN
jgi:hypothetical protein